MNVSEKQRPRIVKAVCATFLVGVVEEEEEDRRPGNRSFKKERKKKEEEEEEGKIGTPLVFSWPLVRVTYTGARRIPSFQTGSAPGRRQKNTQLSASFCPRLAVSLRGGGGGRGREGAFLADPEKDHTFPAPTEKARLPRCVCVCLQVISQEGMDAGAWGNTTRLPTRPTCHG